MKCISLTKFPNSNIFTNCGQCKPCRINRKIEWKTKLLLEQKFYGDQLAFITLTYSTENLPREENYGIKYQGGTLSVPEAQKFIKRFRKNYYHAYPLTPAHSIRYFMVGEYGSENNTQRAHYHAIIFGVDPERAKNIMLKSWKKGNPEQQRCFPVTKGAMDYVSGYTMKKMTSPKDFPDGREPEFSIKSTQPALGHIQIPAIVKQLRKHNIIPNTTAWNNFLLQEEKPNQWNINQDSDIFNGILGSKFHMRLDKPFKDKIRQYMCYEDDTYCEIIDHEHIIQPKSYKIRQNRLHHDSYLAKMENIRNGENEKSRKKAEKNFRRSEDKKKL